MLATRPHLLHLRPRRTACKNVKTLPTFQFQLFIRFMTFSLAGGLWIVFFQFGVRFASSAPTPQIFKTCIICSLYALHFFPPLCFVFHLFFTYVLMHVYICTYIYFFSALPMLAAHNLYYAPAYKMHGYVRRGGVASHWPTGELASWQAGKLAKRKALWPEPQFRRHETCINLTFPMPPRSESRKKSEIKWGFSSFAL